MATSIWQRCVRPHDKCGYKDVDALVSAIDGLRIVGEGEEKRVVTTRVDFEEGAAPSTPCASTDGASSSTGQRRRPPPPPPAAPAPVLTPSGAKVLSLDTFVQSPSAKMQMDGLGAWGGALGYPGAGTPTAAWAQGWDATAWQSPYGSMGYPPPGDAGLLASDGVPEPPSTSAL